MSNTTIQNLPPAISLTGSELIPATQNGVTVTITPNQINSLTVDQITGSGSVNYVPKFTASNKIGNSHITDNGNEVGISTKVSAYYRIDLLDSGTGGVGGNDLYSVHSSNGIECIFGAYGNANPPYGYIGTYTNHSFRIITNNTPRFFVSNDGKVSIGSSATTHAFSVTSQGTIRLGANQSSTLYLNGEIFLANGVGTAGQVLASRGSDFQAEWIDVVTTTVDGTANYIPRFTGANSLDNSNLFDGGTSVTSNKRFNVGGTYSRIDILSDGTGGAAGSNLLSIHSTNNVETLIGARSSYGYSGTYSSNPYIFLTANSERMRITTSGQVGIGTANPQAKLDVSENILVSGITVGGSSTLYNTVVGQLALAGANPGTSNIAVGVGAMSALNGGTDNVAVGGSSMYFAGSGSYNTAVGGSTLVTNSTGAYNTSIGYRSLSENKTGSYNVAIGYRTGAQISAAGAPSHIIAIGDYSQSDTVVGDYNIGLGSYSLAGCSGSNNIGIGYQSLYTKGANYYNVAIGNNSLYSATSGAADPLGIVNPGSGYTNGTYTNVQLTLQSGLAYTSPAYATIVVSGNQVTSVTITNPGTGFNAGFGTTYLTASIPGGSGLILEVQNWVYSNSNVAIGKNSLMDSIYASGNIAIGEDSLKNATSTSNNIAIGKSAQYNSIGNTSGQYNIAIGEQTLYANNAGSYNIAIGYAALGNGTSGSENIAIGSFAFNNGGSGLAIGSHALDSANSNTYNLAIGNSAGSDIITGTGNTIIGGYAGTATLTGFLVMADRYGQPVMKYDSTNQLWSFSTYYSPASYYETVLTIDNDLATFNTNIYCNGYITTSEGVLPRVYEVSSVAGTIAWNHNSYDLVSVTAQTGSLTVTGGSGTTVPNGTKVTFRITAGTGGCTVTFTTTSSNFKGIGITVPSSRSVAQGETLMVGAIWNTNSNYWEIVALTQG